ncbi:hypothetical protein PF011_g8122 [Phytophthora fragariae]|uniref:Uncharacterized protein n=1 Tax=Phytophthora fragariae TaxID=53985 RepID=A0A6A3L668_9STRA|nr:hypothetical protein PF011_g8122 [Phytophthora fragariae]
MCELDNCDMSLDEKEYYDDEADYYYEGGFEEDAMPYETVVSIPSNDYYDDDAACDKESTPEPDHDCEMKTGAESCMLQAASETACNKMSTPEPDHEYETNPEVDACRMQAASVMTACDEASTPEPEHDYDKNSEAEACMLQAASVMTACDKVSTPVYDQDYEEKLESAPEPDPDCEPTLPPDARATQAASVTSTRGEASALEPNPDHEVSSERNTPESAAEMPAEAFLSDDIPDRSVNAVRVLFQRPSCEPDPNRTVIYESFGMKTGWVPARAAESNPALVTPTKPPESSPPVVEEPQAEGVDGPELVPKRADPDDTKTATPHA